MLTWALWQRIVFSNDSFVRRVEAHPLRNLETDAECEGKRPFLLSGTPSPS